MMKKHEEYKEMRSVRTWICGRVAIMLLLDFANYVS